MYIEDTMYMYMMYIEDTIYMYMYNIEENYTCTCICIIEDTI